MKAGTKWFNTHYVLRGYSENMNYVHKFDQCENKPTKLTRRAKNSSTMFFFYTVNGHILYNDITRENMSMKEYCR